jgi:hypothetical protein
MRFPFSPPCWTAETVYAVTSLTVIKARPAELAAIVRGHWIGPWVFARDGRDR